jgi:hypothetical protein
MRTHDMLRFLIVALLVSGCGMMEPPEPAEPPEVNVTIVDPNDRDPDQPGNGGTSYAEIQTIIDRRCISCHAGIDFTLSESQLRDSRAYEEVDGDNMPPGNPLQGSEKSKFLSFFLSPASLIVDIE